MTPPTGSALRRLMVLILLTGTGCGGPPPTEHSAASSLRDGLVAWWRFDEGNGARTADASGHGNAGTVDGGDWGTGVSGRALASGGADDGIVRVTQSPSLRSTANAITVSAWVWREAIHNVAVVAHGYPRLFFGFHGAQFKWQVRNVWGRLAACYADPHYQAGTGRWLNVTGTYDGLALRLYADGEPICRRWQIGNIELDQPLWTLSGYLDRQGAIVDENSGRIDEVRIYQRALSEAEVRALYQQDRPLSTQPGPG